MRNVPTRTLTASTSTGTSSEASFPDTKRFVGVTVENPSTNAFVYTVEAAAGHSTWFEVLAAATSTGTVSRLSTGGALVSKARVNVSSNATTGVDVWLSAY